MLIVNKLNKIIWQNHDSATVEHVLLCTLFVRLNLVKTEERFTRHIGKRTSFYLFYPESQHAGSITDPVSINILQSYI